MALWNKHNKIHIDVESKEENADVLLRTCSKLTDHTKNDTEESGTEQTSQEPDNDETVWLAGTPIYSRSLTVKHKKMIEDPDGWLDSDIIDYCLAHFKDSFSRATFFRKAQNGLESCLVVGRFLKWCNIPPPAVSIINTDASAGGTHWITFSSHKQGVVRIYDSSREDTKLGSDTKEVICNATKRKADKPFQIWFMPCDFQHNNFDCGVFAIANAFALCSGINPVHLKYEAGEQMRKHLIKCMVDKAFTRFPSKFVLFNKSRNKRALELLKLSCICSSQMLHFQCAIYEKWFHRMCESFDEQLGVYLPTVNTCIKCRQNVERREDNEEM